MKYGCLVFILASCAHLAKDFDNDVQNGDASKVLPDVQSVISYVPVEATISDKIVSTEFKKEDKLVTIQGRRAPVKHLSLDINDTKFLRVSGVHVQNFDGKTVGVHPIFKVLQGTKEFATPFKQWGWRGICGLNACQDLTYDLSALPKGKYDLVVAAYVKDPNNPDGKLEDSMKRTAPLYPAYYGEVRFELVKTP